MKTNLATANQNEIAPPINVGDSVFSSMTRFQDTMKMSEFLATSDLVPTQYQKKPANVVIALAMANRMNADPMMVMQNLYIVHGRPGWSSQFLIACVNSCGRFSALQYEFSGEPNTDLWSCRAYATELATGQVVYGPSVSIAMAKAEGWHGKNGSKWKTMPELMLTYRAAAFFVRTKAPEISMGMQTDEEIRDMGDAVVVGKERNVGAPESISADIMSLQKPSVQQAEAPQGEPEIDLVKFFKQAIDTCHNLDILDVCGNDIKEHAEKGDFDSRPDDLLEIKRYYDTKLKALKAEAQPK